jgi:hypothetical protein
MDTSERDGVLQRAIEDYSRLAADRDIAAMNRMLDNFSSVVEFLEQFQDPRLCQIVLRAARLSWGERERLVEHMDRILESRDHGRAAVARSSADQ